ncbi:MAG TPA: hypothetical protein VFL94_01695 [Actinomycetales bacterium]|nr:hypothetical protein [Actinomycetales bacterium]
MQPQRTALAWQRTAVAGLLLSLITLGASAHRFVAAPPGWHGHVPAWWLLPGAVAGAAAVVAAVDAVVVVPRQVSSMARHPSSDPLESPYWRLRLVVAATVLLSLAGALLAAVGVAASVASCRA